MRKMPGKPESDDLLRDVLAIGSWTVGLILLIGVVSPDSGWFGRVFGGALTVIAGMGSIAIPIALGLLGWVLIRGVTKPATRNQYVGIVLFFFAVVAFCQMIKTANLHDAYATLATGDPDRVALEVRHGGGVVGFMFAYLLEAAFGRLCSFIMLSGMLVISFLLVTKIPATEMASWCIDGVKSVFGLFMRLIRPRSQERSERRPRTEKKLEVKPKSGKTMFEALAEKIHPAGGETETSVPVKPKVTINGGAAAKSNVNSPTQPSSRPAPKDDSDFVLPPLTLLNEPVPPPKRAQDELNYKISKIETTLEEFKIEAEVREVSHGPTVTRYEIHLAPGIKVSKIVSLADNLAMALAAIDVRVEAPIPGKSAIGVEVPNDHPAIVSLREVIDTDQFWNAPSKLTFALGKDVAGQPRYADLSKMPHMLIAGATNAGKSICLNTLIGSLLYRATPRELKFILIDPKRVELSLFDGIPHLSTPVIKDVRQAAGILRTVCKEMDKRYDKLAFLHTKNLEGYNAKVKPEERLPYIVVVVDELADLMMQAGPEVEFCVCRLAQLARAVGIHLVIATQRPSVDVITGTIKANISSRISFAVSSHIDSRTVLDMSGAERLIGRGDMLFKPIDVSKPSRIQGCFVTEKEINDLVKYLKEQESPEYSMEPSFVGETGSGTAGGGGNSDGSNDELYEPAVRLVVNTGYASTSMIQRRFKVGYTRAARLVDTMEEHGLVGPPDGSKPREILIGKGDLDRVFGKPLFGDDEEEPVDSEQFNEEEEE